jgi:hypothetical protein
MKALFHICIMAAMLVASVISDSALAQDTGFISGVITEVNGIIPISDVAVSVYDSLGNQVAIGVSFHDGSFLFDVIPGIYSLHFIDPDFADTSLSDIAVTANETSFVSLVMREIACHYVIGDVNESGRFNGIDITYMVHYLQNDPVPIYLCDCPTGNRWHVNGDLNGSCNFNGIDVTYGVNYLKGGPSLIPCIYCPPANQWKWITLVWNAQPSDLDLHLWTPLFVNDSMLYHICFYNRGNENQPPYAVLERDEVYGYGPEIMSIYQHIPGYYYVAAYHYSGSGTIATSGARVSITEENGTFVNLTVPADSAGANWWWHICSINGTTGEIIPLNILSPDPPIPEWLEKNPPPINRQKK